MHQLSVRAVQELRRFLEQGQGWVCELADGEIRIVPESLPGRAVVGVARQGPVFWVIVDLDKPGARQHLSDLIYEWPLREDGPVTRLDDAIDLLRPITCGDGLTTIRLD